MAGVHSSFPSERPAQLSSLSQSNSGPISRVCGPDHQNTLTSAYYSRHSNKHAHRKPDSLGHRFSGTAFGWSSFLTFVSRRSLELRSAPPVNPACAALRGAYTKIASCSLPRPPGSAPLRRLTAPPCAPSLANYETNVFYWPAKAQFQLREAHPK